MNTPATLVGTPTPNTDSAPGKVLWDIVVQVGYVADGEPIQVFFPVLAVSSARLPGLMRKSAAGTLTVKLG